MPKIRHFAIMCEDPSQLAQFYGEVFEMHEVWRQGPHVYMSDGTLNVALLQTRDPARRGINHFGFHVEDMEEIRRRLEGVEVDPPYKKPGDGRYAELGAIDPEGNRFDLSVAGWDMERTKADMTEDEWRAQHPGGAGAGG
jgi:catechol 2,3-dioxygenase-like lactoylglutathione lyase family enzyme